jgi:hypothetical protein
MSKERQPTIERQARPAENPAQAPQITLDDLALRVELLAGELRSLRESEPAPDIRPDILPEVHQEQPGEEVVAMAEQEDSITVKAGSKTYFFDLKQTRDNKPYLLITESRFKGEGEERERVSISIFPETAEAFGQAVTGMMARLGEPVPDRR